jgi:hypothetical protein
MRGWGSTLGAGVVLILAGIAVVVCTWWLA